MFPLYAAATGLVLLVTFLFVCFRHKDPFHPAVFLTPMCGYLWGFIPWVHHSRGLLADYPPSFAQESFAQLVIFLCNAALCIGLVSASPRKNWKHSSVRMTVLTAEASDKLRTVGFVLAGIALFVYWLQLLKAGGFIRAFSRGKGGGASLGSGYLNELVLLCLPAVMIYLFSRARSAFTIGTLFTCLLILSPLLLQGLLGGRRGPTFLACAALGAGWYVFRGKRPPLIIALVGIAMSGLLMLFLVSERRELYIGAEYQFESESFKSTVIPSELNPGSTTVSAWNTIIACDYFERFYLGRRFFAQLVVRPIPRQIWPTKYEDLGVAWMVTNPGSGSFSPAEWIRATGALPVAGSANGFAADSFLEFGWGCLLLCWAAGFFYAFLWKKSITHRGIWVLLYLEAGAVSVYLVSQGMMSAWMYRFLFLAGPTVLIWKVFAPSMEERGKGWRLISLPFGQRPPSKGISVKPFADSKPTGVDGN